MHAHSSDPTERLREIQQEVKKEAARQRQRWHYRIRRRRVRFERRAQEAHRRMKRSVLRFLRESSLPNLLTAPLIYSMIVPLVLLDLWVSMYQRACFPVYGIPRVRRRDYLIIDRHRLAYLNAIEKANCVYCGYANGLIEYVREVAARTEQYWCPIKHARALRASHARYRRFVDYGDAEGYHGRLPELRRSWSIAASSKRALPVRVRR